MTDITTRREQALKASIEIAHTLEVRTASKITAHLLSAKVAEAEGDWEDADAHVGTVEDILAEMA